MSNQRVSLEGFPTRLNRRNISESTCQKYRIHKDGDRLRFYYHSADGELVGCKTKTKDKIFRYEGITEGTFFGQHLWPSQGKMVVITEGELDAASVYQVLRTWPVVSLPNGSAAAKKSIKANLEWLQGYTKVVLLFDNDEAGRSAAKEAASVLPPGKVFINFLEGYKDASDALQADDLASITRAVWDAKPYRPDGIIDGKSLLELVTTPNPPNDYDYPFKGLNKMLHGIRYGELVTWTAGSGVGKSSVCRLIMTHLLEQGAKVGGIFLEESNKRTALGLMSAALGKQLHIGEHERTDLAKAYEETLAKWNLFLLDGFGSFDPDVIYNRIEYMATGLDCKIIFLDHLSILLSGLDGDERRMIDVTMTKLRSLVERTGITLFLVSHLRRTQSDHNHEEGARVTLGQLKGSSGISQLSDSVIALERDQQSGSKHSLTTVRVLKNRFTGEVGVAGQLKYDLETCKFTEYEAEPDFDPTTDF